MEILKHLQRILRQIDQTAAFDGHHNKDRFSEFPADFITLAALHCRIVIIQIVKLDLNHFNLGIFCQNLLKDVRPVVEGDPEVTELSFFFQFKSRLICVAFFEIFKILCRLGVHQIKIKVVYSAGLQLAFKHRPDVFLFLKIRACQLIRQNIPVTGIPAGQTFTDRRLAFPVKISMGRIKIVKPVFQKSIHHTGEFLSIHFSVFHRKPHASKTEILLYIFKNILILISTHLSSSLV